MFIAVDFDGTIADFDKNANSKEISGAFEVLKLISDAGHDLILYTMRNGRYLEEAVEFCKKNNIHFAAVNDNPFVDQSNFSRKVFADYYIDERAIGCPVYYNSEGSRCADWDKIKKMLKELGVI
ncbi:MAG TPA: hypothetical protein ENN58_00890 [bacterium]|nr:hypothetical protein [bacterium]